MYWKILFRFFITRSMTGCKQTAHILGQLEGDEPLVMLKEALKNDLDWEVRVAVIKAFNPKLAYKVKDIVNRALEDTHFIVRQCAAYFLSQMKAKEK